MRVGDKPLDVKVRVPEVEIDHREALRVMARGQLIGDAHPAVQLDRHLGNGAARTPDVRLRGRHRAAAFRGVIRVGLHCGEQRNGLRLLEMDEHVHRAVLQDLKTADRLAELLARLDVFEGLGVEVYDIYGMTETGGVGTLGMDCPAHAGLHVWEDHVHG